MLSMEQIIEELRKHLLETVEGITIQEIEKVTELDHDKPFRINIGVEITINDLKRMSVKRDVYRQLREKRNIS